LIYFENKKQIDKIKETKIDLKERKKNSVPEKSSIGSIHLDSTRRRWHLRKWQVNFGHSLLDSLFVLINHV